MNKYSFALFKEIQSLLEEENDFSVESKISDIFSENFGDISWSTALFNIELIYGFEIPDLLAEQTELTMTEFGKKLSALPTIPAAMYPEFYAIKIQLIIDYKRADKIENGLEEGTQEEVSEMNEILNALGQRLKEITEYPLK